jgi:flagellar FliL protein
MATEEAEVAAETAEAAKPAGGGIAKTAGMVAGLFVLMIVSQLVTPILGCKFMSGVMPGCPAHEAPKSTDGKPAAKPAKSKEPPQYLAFDPPLVVSFQDQSTMRFLQVTVEVMGRSEETLAAVKTHMPVIRNNLLMMLGGRNMQQLTDREGKEKLRQEALAEVQRILKENTGKPGVEDLYFTSFVVQ